MLVRQGDWLVVPNPAGDEVYRIDRVAFDETYESEAAREEKINHMKKNTSPKKMGPTPPAGLPSRREPAGS